MRPVPEEEALQTVQVVPYDPLWTRLYDRERALLLEIGADDLVDLEHIGSTAVPGLAAKPIIDMMAAASDRSAADDMARRLEGRGYALISTGMEDRLFLRRRAPDGHLFQLHVVEAPTWPLRHERLMRDYLRAHPEAAHAYGDLKRRLARAYAEDSLGYTRAKTTFIQAIVDSATKELGIARIAVWPD